MAPLPLRGRQRPYHCFMAMYDIMKNPDIPLADILARQQLIGGNNVAATSDKDTWKAPYYEEKAVMINKFYRYVQQNYQTGFELSWSEWLNPSLSRSKVILPKTPRKT